MIKIIGLGPGAPEALTLGALEALKQSKKVILRTEKHPTVEYLNNNGVNFSTLDNFYEDGKSFDEVYEKIADEVIEIYKSEGELIYAVPGHPLVAERSVFNLIELCKKENIEYKVLPAVSFVDAMMESLMIDPIDGLKIIDAFDIKEQVLDKRIGTIITQVYNRFIASEVKLELSEYYDDETEIIFVRAAGIEGLESIRKIPLYELDMQEDIDYLTSIYIPKDLNNKKDFNDLISIVETLRGENGCPWDKEQTHQSLKSDFIEECYELVEAIEDDNIDGMIEELGDILLHVVFQSSIGNEDGYFNVLDVIEGICTKMIYRHPHVFADATASNSEEVLAKWDDLKSKEKCYNTLTEKMNGVAKTIPALTKAKKIQKIASKVGFDWDDAKDATDKVAEEINEILDVYKSGNMEKITDEVGDLLFASVNVARLLGVNEEEALNSTIKKFISRFSFIEETALKQGKSLENMTLEEMDELWNEAKNNKTH